MSQRTYSVTAVWDPEAKVYYAQSDIIGLHVEAANLEDFQALVRDLAVELIMTNHVSPEEIANTPIRDLVPGIIWSLPETSPVPT